MTWEKTVMSESEAGAYMYQVSTSQIDPFGKDDGTIVGGNHFRFVRTQQLLEAQAKIAFKAGYDEGLADGGVIGIKIGQKSVVEWVNKNCLECQSNSNKDEYLGFHKEAWQAQLKDWGMGNEDIQG